ncbi:MAG: hypothetical protein ABL977_12820 [Candidatus Eisenbacteria bacterium]
MLTAAMRTESGRPLVWSLLASVYEYEGKQRLADRLLVGAARRFPKSAEIRLDRVELAAESESWDKVLGLAKRIEKELRAKRIIWKASRREEDFYLLYARAALCCDGTKEELSVLGRALSALPESQQILAATATAIARSRLKMRRLKTKSKLARHPRGSSD